MERRWYAFYHKDVSRTIAYPKVSLKDLFNRNAENNPDRPYLIFQEMDEMIHQGQRDKDPII
jgi:hypothetical protein